jgi:uncharacterized small protein (DUF1192 family)
VPQDDPPVQRPDTDDYDLLTYGEASARLAELLNAERQRLSALRRDPNADPVAVVKLEQRIAMLQSSDERYRQQSASSQLFLQRFGLSGAAASAKPKSPRRE